MSDAQHIPVLTRELVSGLSLASNATVVDCTLGSAGHAAAILQELGADGAYIGIDIDPRAVAEAAWLHDEYNASIHLVNESFQSISSILAGMQIESIDAIVADLGWRSEQFETERKGFSFLKEEPLLMTYGDPTLYPFTAADIVNTFSKSSLADILRGYGEERYTRRIVEAICAAREQGEIKTSKELATIIMNAVPARVRSYRIHPATKTFQAIRMAVNDELGALEDLLTSGFTALASGGRMAIISFHSKEDRIVKRFFRNAEDSALGVRITKRPITPSYDELKINRRARSAKLRILKKNRNSYDES